MHFLGFDLVFHDVAEFMALAHSLCVFQRNLGLGVLDRLDDLSLAIHAHILLLRVDGDADVGVASVFLLVRGGEGGFDLAVHILFGNAFFLLQKIKCRENFCVHNVLPLKYLSLTQ